MPKPVTTDRTAQGVERLHYFADRSKRTSVQFPPQFLRDDTLARTPPLAHMVRGGQGGEVRLKLYLTMTMLATKAPHDLPPIPARSWAETLCLPDPLTNGARRITDAIDWLSAEKMIKTSKRTGMPKDVTLLSPGGTGKGYSWRGSWYVSIPIGFWKQEWIYQLSGSAVAFLLVLRDMRSGRAEGDPPWLTTSQKERYGFSEDTWTRATQELEANNLLTTSRAPQGKDFDFRRLRKTYWVRTELLQKPIEDVVPTGTL
jgi:hypothetical protein